MGPYVLICVLILGDKEVTYSHICTYIGKSTLFHYFVTYIGKQRWVPILIYVLILVKALCFYLLVR